MTGRELADEQLNLRFNEQTKHWDFIGFEKTGQKLPDPVLEALAAFMKGRHEWHGTATELIEILQDHLDPETRPNILTRKLNASISRLEQDYGIHYRTSRNHDARTIHLAEAGCDANDASDDISGAA